MTTMTKLETQDEFLAFARGIRITATVTSMFPIDVEIYTQSVKDVWFSFLSAVAYEGYCFPIEDAIRWVSQQTKSTWELEKDGSYTLYYVGI